MVTSNKPVKIHTAWLVLGCAISTFLARGYVWPTLSPVEIPTIRAILDPTLFARDFVVQESLQFTPRFYYNYLVVSVAQTGLPLAISFALLHLAALSVFAWAIKMLTETLRLSGFESAILAGALLFCTGGCVGGTFFVTHAPVPSVWAHCVALLGLAFAVRKQSVRAYVCIAVATLFQFLVGFYAGLIALPILFHTKIRRGAFAIAVWSVGLALVYIPISLAERSSIPLSAAEFVHIYAYTRHPHHLVPSLWPTAEWFSAIVFYIGAWTIPRRNSENPEANLLFRAGLATGCVALFLNYLGIELYSSALIAKLQPARVTPLLQSVTLIHLIAITRARRAPEDRYSYVRFALLGLVPYGGLGIIVERILARTRLNTLGAIASLGSLAIGLAALIALHPLRAFAVCGLTALWWQLHTLTRDAHAFARTLFGLILTALGVSRWSVAEEYPAVLAERLSIHSAPRTSTAKIGAWLKPKITSGVLVYIQPDADSWDFKLYSNASTVVEEKHFPFTTSGIVEWQKRMKIVRTADATPPVIYAPLSSHQVRALAQAKQFGATHLLLHRTKEHPPKEMLELVTIDDWTLYEIHPAPATH